MVLPETRYTKSGDVHIAYQVIGSGPIDLVFVPGFISNLEHYWEDPGAAQFLNGLASFSRLILFDKRGTGLSDRMSGIPSLEERMDDVRAVMDAAGSRRAAVLGISEGGAMSVLFAATYPERVQALILYGAYGHFSSWVVPPARFEPFLEMVEQKWGTGETVRAFAPSRADDERFKRWWARFERSGASPSAVIALLRMNNDIDIRNILPAISVPSLILHRQGDTRVNVEAGRYLADRIPGARYVELRGDDHVAWVGDVDAITSEIQEFLTGSRAAADDADRVLATVLFTDIVDSTRRVAELGDRGWRALLDRHNEIARREIQRYRGREVKTLGDGFLATFDGPARAVRCANDIAGGVHAALGVDIRSGVHTGEIEVKGDDIGGIAVHIASRVAALAGAGEVLVSATVRDLVAGSGLRFRDIGRRAVKGLPEELSLYQLDAAAAPRP
jgi:pimeloyl-ACP methyl ester carboxylesterase